MYNIDKLLEFFSQGKESSLDNFSRLLRSNAKIYLPVLLVMNFLIWIYARYIEKAIDEPLMALHYNIDSGVDFYGNSDYIYVIPLTGLTVIIMNTALSAIIARRKDREFVFHILFSTAILSHAVLIIALRIIYLVNFR